MLKNANVIGNTADSHISVLACSRYIFLGWFANSITWFRLGDAYRAYVFTEDTGYSFSRAMGTVLSERVMDVVMIFLLIALAALAFYGASDTGNISAFLVIAFLLVFVGLTGLLIMKHFGTRIARFLPTQLKNHYDRFHEGAMGSFERLPTLFLISSLIWFTEIGRLYFVVQSLDLSMTVSLSLIVFVTLANAILTTVPITPGGLGIVEPGIVGLLALAMIRNEAVSVAILDRSISYLSIVVLGGVVFFLHQASRNRRRGYVLKS